jgi:hypothetical protein
VKNGHNIVPGANFEMRVAVGSGIEKKKRSLPCKPGKTKAERALKSSKCGIRRRPEARKSKGQLHGEDIG